MEGLKPPLSFDQNLRHIRTPLGELNSRIHICMALSLAAAIITGSWLFLTLKLEPALQKAPSCAPG